VAGKVPRTESVLYIFTPLSCVEQSGPHDGTSTIPLMSGYCTRQSDFVAFCVDERKFTEISSLFVVAIFRRSQNAAAALRAFIGHSACALKERKQLSGDRSKPLKVVHVLGLEH